MSYTTTHAAMDDLKKERQRILRDMKARIRRIFEERNNEQAKIIEETRSDAKRHHLAIQKRRKCKQRRGIYKSDDDGYLLATPEAKLREIEKGFQKVFGADKDAKVKVIEGR